MQPPIANDTPSVAPWGAWESPLKARDVGRVALDISHASANDGQLYWIESRAAEGGRCALMTLAPDGSAVEALAGTPNVRSRVHEYGGRPYAVAGDASARSLVYCALADQRL